VQRVQEAAAQTNFEASVWFCFRWHEPLKLGTKAKLPLKSQPEFTRGEHGRPKLALQNAPYTAS
jgi:hypothetical protein